MERIRGINRKECDEKMTSERKKYLKKKRKEKILVFIVQIGILITFLGIWELLSKNNIIDS